MAIIEKLDGSRYDLTKYGIPLLKVNPVDIIYDSENVRGRPGRNRTDRYHGVRKLQLTMLLNAKSETDTIILRDKLAAILDDVEDFYLYEQVSKGYKFELPGETSFKTSIDQLQWHPHMYKRWRVERINNDGIEWDGYRGKRVIEFETSDLPYAETPFTSLDIQSMEKSWLDGRLAWQLGVADWNNPLPSYTFNSNTFNVLNGGNVKVDPRCMPLKIILKGSFSSNATIRNNTTGEVFIYKGSLTSSDTLVLDRISYLKNGAHITGSTNKKLISLAKGNNSFSVSGGTVTSISFEFPFYYL
ncbi:MAG: phage tail domain-containing protein [Solibacillus sp.]|uniref:phage tail domain-containing protein n=1 Tax=Solibacillus sp. TaxID=1909654 RepID=UPI0033162B36